MLGLSGFATAPVQPWSDRFPGGSLSTTKEPFPIVRSIFPLNEIVVSGPKPPELHPRLGGTRFPGVRLEYFMRPPRTDFLHMLIYGLLVALLFPSGAGGHDMVMGS